MSAVWAQVAKVDYPAILAAAWEQHLAPRAEDAPTVVSLFAGCGGSSLGYSMAGFRELLAVEWDDNAVETFRINFPDVPVYHGDIAKLSVEECLSLVGLEPGQLDVLDGSPPCQGFSTAGKRQLDDPRNNLFREYVRLLRGLRPKVFVMENVSGMVKGKMKLVFAEAMRELKGSGYRVSARLMNAMYFHVPQSRQRLIFVGVREDVGKEPSHPKAEYKPIAIKDAVPGLLATRSLRINPWIDAQKPAATICKTTAGYQALQCEVIMPPFDDKYARPKSRIPKGGNAADVIGKGYNSCCIPDPDKPSPTLPKTQTGRGFATIAHWAEPRALTIDEAKRIASFPDPMQFIGKYSEQWARIGNSVPPLFMRAIAGHVRREILTTANQEAQRGG
jgi:DNA (cytosine-5)-methyltransferase 1